MAFLNGTFLGYSAFETLVDSPLLSFTKVTLYGGQSIFDKLHIKNIALTNDEIIAIDPTTKIKWGLNTNLLAEFDTGTLDGGNVISLPNALIGWKIYRRDLSNNISTLIAVVDAGIHTYVDYTVGTYKNYQYEFMPYNDDVLGSPLVTDVVNTNFFGWYLMNYNNPDVVYKFDLNFSSNQLSNETDITIYNTFVDKPSVGIGNRNYLKGSISCIAGSIIANGTLYQPIEYLDDLRNFINNQKPKMLKSRKGDVWKVTTDSMSIKYMDDIGEQPATITFNFNGVI